MRKLRAAGVALLASGAGLVLPAGIAHAEGVGMVDRLGAARPDDGAQQAGEPGGVDHGTAHLPERGETGEGLTAIPWGGLG